MSKPLKPGRRDGAPLRSGIPLGEAALFDLLRKRYPAREYALFSHVADSTGNGRSRTADALAMGLWPSRGLKLYGFEMKSYRNDWLRELKKPGKAEPVAKFCDFWIVVAGAKDVVRAEELPPTWGLLLPAGDCLVEQRAASQRNDVVPMDRTFMASILRAANKSPVSGEHDLFQIKEAERRRLQRAHDDEIDRIRKRHEDELKEIRSRLGEFNDGLGLVDVGLAMNQWNGRSKEIGRAIQFLVNGGFDGMDRELSTMLKQLARMTSTVEAVVRERERAAVLVPESALNEVLP